MRFQQFCYKHISRRLDENPTTYRITRGRGGKNGFLVCYVFFLLNKMGDLSEKSAVVRVHEEWEKVMRRNNASSSKTHFFGPSSLVSGNNDLCCDLLENICKQPSIDASRVTEGDDFPPDVPVFTAEHESKLLQEHHSINLPNGARAHMRACVCGQKCVGLEPHFRNFEQCGGRILREALTPEELIQFETNGTVPTEPRMCVLCSRKHAMTAYFWCLHERPETMLQHTIINAYVNPVDCENGYISELTIPNVKDGSWRCMIGPVVTNMKSEMFWYKKKEVWCINQDALIWNKKKKGDEEVSVF